LLRVKAESATGIQIKGVSVLYRRREQQAVEGLEGGGTTWDEMVAENHQTQKVAQLTLGTGLGKLLDHSNNGGEGPYAVLVHVVAQNTLGSKLDAVVL